MIVFGPTKVKTAARGFRGALRRGSAHADEAGAHAAARHALAVAHKKTGREVRRVPRCQPAMRSTAASACAVASAAQQSTTMRSGIARSHVSWRLQSWRVANTPLSRIVS